MEKERAKGEKALREKLDKAGISGSAVIPNIEADRVWVQFKSEKRENFYQGLDLLMDG